MKVQSLLLLFLASTLVLGMPRKKPQDHLSRGNLLLQQNKVEEAIAEFREALKQSPGSADAHRGLGDALARKGSRDEALTEFREALRLKPDDGPTHIVVGQMLIERGEIDSAAAECREALRLQPDLAEGHACLGVALSKEGDRDQAIAEFLEAVRLKPDLAEAHSDLGSLLRAKGELESAVKELQEALRLKPDLAEARETLELAHFELADKFYSQRDWDNAASQYRLAVQLKPDHAEAHFKLGGALYQKSDYAAAIAEYREVIRLKPDYAHAYDNIGHSLRALGDLDGAIAAFREAVRLDPGNAVVRDSLGDVLKRKGDLDGALEAYREATQVGPQYMYARLNLGDVLRAKGDLDGAIAEYREAIRLSPVHPLPHNNLGETLEAKGDREAAFAEYETAYKLAPRESRVVANYERLKMELKRTTVTAGMAPTQNPPPGRQQPPPSEYGSIEGTVVNATTGELLPGIPVWIPTRGDPRNPAQVYSARTDARGHFVIEKLPTGQYLLHAGGIQLPEQDYKERVQAGPANNPGNSREQGRTFHIFHGNRIGDVVFRVKLGCAIAGTVSDEDGHPIYGIRVGASQPSLAFPGGISMGTGMSAETNPFGEYCIGTLGGGHYYLYVYDSGGRPPIADGMPLDKYVSTYYPGTTDVRQAALVHVPSGEGTATINLKFIRSRGVVVSGRVVSKSTGKPVPRAVLEVMPRTVRFEGLPSQTFESRVENEAGTFEIPGVPPGSFTILAQGDKDMVGLAPVDVKDRDVGDVSLLLENIDMAAVSREAKDVAMGLPLNGGKELGGHVRADPGVKIDFTKLEIQLLPETALLPYVRGAEMKADGTFVFHNLLEGGYRLHVQGFPEEFYPKSARLGDIDVYGSGLNIPQPTPLGTLEIKLALDGGRIDGTVVKDHKPVPDAMVVLVPDPPNRDRDNLYSESTSDKEGKFSMIGLAPGDFRIYARAVSPSDQLIGNNPEYLQLHADHGKPVHIEPSKTQSVQLELIADN